MVHDNWKTTSVLCEVLTRPGNHRLYATGVHGVCCGVCSHCFSDIVQVSASTKVQIIFTAFLVSILKMMNLIQLSQKKLY